MRLPPAIVLVLALAGVVHGVARAQEGVVRIEERQFKAGAGRITFSEVPLGTVNPVYPPSQYRGGPDSPTVRFAGFFRGRRLGVASECPPGAEMRARVLG